MNKEDPICPKCDKPSLSLITEGACIVCGTGLDSIESEEKELDEDSEEFSEDEEELNF